MIPLSDVNDDLHTTQGRPMATDTEETQDGRQTLFLGPLHEPLREVSFLTRRSRSAIVREALADWFAKQRPASADRAAS